MITVLRETGVPDLVKIGRPVCEIGLAAQNRNTHYKHTCAKQWSSVITVIRVKHLGPEARRYKMLLLLLYYYYRKYYYYCY